MSALLGVRPRQGHVPRERSDWPLLQMRRNWTQGGGVHERGNQIPALRRHGKTSEPLHGGTLVQSPAPLLLLNHGDSEPSKRANG